MEAKTIGAAELLKTRYKVVADYPNSSYDTGDILEETDRVGYWKVGDSYVWDSNIERFPAIFKPLQWWQERTEKDVPYVKDRFGVYKVKKLQDAHSNYGYVHLRSGIGITTNYEPATAAEYTEYQQANHSK